MSFTAFIKAAMVAAAALICLTACSGGSPCTDSAVLAKLKELQNKQQFGQFIDAPSKVFVVQAKSATEVSADKDGTKKRCSVLVTTDLIEMMRFTKKYSEDDLAKIKAEAPKKGFALTKDDLVTFTVQPLADGQNYVTLLP